MNNPANRIRQTATVRPVTTHSSAQQQAAMRNQQLMNSKASPVQLTNNTTGHIKQGNFYPDPVVKTHAVNPSSLYVQAASFGNQNSAMQYANTLERLGEVQVKPALVNGKNYYRVRLGPFDNVPAADGALQQLASLGKNDAIVVVD